MRSRGILIFPTLLFIAGCSCSSVCDKGTLVASGGGTSQAAAEQDAITSWESKAYAIAPAYGSWLRAKNKSVGCSKSPTSNYWTCEAKGDPCRKE